MSSDKPIIFCGEMVRAIIEGRKTKTRRLDGLHVINRKPDAWRYGGPGGYINENAPQYWEWFDNIETGDALQVKCPYWPGQMRWVRETHAIFNSSPINPSVFYKADAGTPGHCDLGWYEATLRNNGMRWRPSIHMPRWASRLTLEATDIRAQRVQEISETDAAQEGVWLMDSNVDRYYCMAERTGGVYRRPSEAFRELWDSINAERGYGWSVNPWIWAVTFRVAEGGKR